MDQLPVRDAMSQIMIIYGRSTLNTLVDGDDYTFVTMELPLIQRSVSQCFTLTILSDDILETSETFQLMLSTTDDNVLIGVSSSLTAITILNDDGMSH